MFEQIKVNQQVRDREFCQFTGCIGHRQDSHRHPSRSMADIELRVADYLFGYFCKQHAREMIDIYVRVSGRPLVGQVAA